MKRKVIKRLTILSLISIFTLCAAVASANAQLSIPIRAKIPFDFSVGDKKTAAGEYTFSRLSGCSDSKMMSMTSVDASTRMFQSTLGIKFLHLRTNRVWSSTGTATSTFSSRSGPVVNKRERKCRSLAVSELSSSN
jgi:hypothetical protein